MNLKNRLAALEAAIANERTAPVVAFLPTQCERITPEQTAQIEAAKHAALGVLIDVNSGWQLWKHGVLMATAQDCMPA